MNCPYIKHSSTHIVICCYSDRKQITFFHFFRAVIVRFDQIYSSLDLISLTLFLDSNGIPCGTSGIKQEKDVYLTEIPLKDSMVVSDLSNNKYSVGC